MLASPLNRELLTNFHTDSQHYFAFFKQVANTLLKVKTALQPFERVCIRYLFARPLKELAFEF